MPSTEWMHMPPCNPNLWLWMAGGHWPCL